MQVPTLDKLIWSLIFGGLLTLALGLAVQRNSPAVGWAIAAAGGIAAVVGAVLIFVRARMKPGTGS